GDETMKLKLLLILALFAGARAGAAEPQMQAHFIDVGQGACTLLEFPCGAILIDAGGQDAAHSSALVTYLKEFFGRRTDLQNTLSALVISNPHLDHAGGIKAVFGACRVRTYLDNGLVQGSGRAAVQYARDHAAEQNTAVREVRQREIDGLRERTGLSDHQI